MTYEQLEKIVDDLKRQKERSAGAMEQLLDRLKKDFDCSSLEAAKKQARKLEQETATLKDRLDTDIEAFQTKHEHVLKGMR